MKQRPDLSPRKEAERIARTQRLARALRDNLQRRKDQARAQAAAAGEAQAPASLSDEGLSSKSSPHGGMPVD
jgi:hypothetical protein